MIFEICVLKKKMYLQMCRWFELTFMFSKWNKNFATNAL